MGKAGRWLRSFFLTGRKDRKGKDRERERAAGSQSLLSTPSAKEKRRWSFRRAAAAGGKDAGMTTSGRQGARQLASTPSSHCFPEVHAVVVQEQDQQEHRQHAVAASTVVVPPPPASKGRAGGGGDVEEAAAIKIQLTFRSYLARKALCALRGMVKLQAMVRGQLVRRQANVTLRRMQALLAAQKRARAERLRLLGDDVKPPLSRTPRPPTRRRSPHHHRSRNPLEAVDRGSEENVKVVEVDDGGGGGAPRTGGRRSSGGGSYYSPSLSRAPAKAELYQLKVSPTPSGLTDGSARTLSGRLEFDDHSASFSAASDASGLRRGSKAWHAGDHAHAALLYFPNYMSNTESSRAKARSQSAPRQRPSDASAAASPSPSCERPTGWSGARRRASLDPRDLAAAAGVRSGAPSPWSSGARTDRCASQARASASAACPWAVRLDRSSASLDGGIECGSSSTARIA